MMAFSETYSGTPESGSALVALLADTVGPACSHLPGFGWLTSMHVTDADMYTVTSFWDNLDAPVEGYWAPAAEMRRVRHHPGGPEWVKSTWYEVRSVARRRPTVPGNIVVVQPMTCPATAVDETVAWARDLSMAAQSHDDLMFTVVELTDGPQINFVTTWQDSNAADAAKSALEQRYRSDERPPAANVDTHHQLVGTVIYSRAAIDPS